MSEKNTWNYSEAKRNIFERLQKDWDAPKVPCVTPASSFAKKRSCRLMQNPEGKASQSKKMKTNKEEMTLCFMYNLQISDLNIFISRSRHQDWLRMKENEKHVPYTMPKNSSKNDLINSLKHENNVFQSIQLPHAITKSWNRKDFVKPPTLHAIALQYNGPEKHHLGAPIVIKKPLPQKFNPTYSLHENKVKDTQKSFHIDMPQSRMKVGILEPGKYYTELCKHKKKEIFKI